MANHERSRRNYRDDGGPLEEGGRVKTKPVSCSTVGGGASKLKRTSQHLSSEDEDETPSDPQAPRKASKIGFGLSSNTGKVSNPISIKLGASKPKEPVPSAPPKKLGLAAVFNEDDDSEPEEMPPEAKMRMKNIGSTNAGPEHTSAPRGLDSHGKYRDVRHRLLLTVSTVACCHSVCARAPCREHGVDGSPPHNSC
ncbi:PEST proteolytic signal-containing nuclear protein isoform X1 [Festucalex cinctus]